MFIAEVSCVTSEERWSLVCAMSMYDGTGGGVCGFCMEEAARTRSHTQPYHGVPLPGAAPVFSRVQKEGGINLNTTLPLPWTGGQQDG